MTSISDNTGDTPANNVFSFPESLDRMDGDIELLLEIAALLVDDCDRLLPEIREAVSDGAADKLMVSAHTLKGAVSNIVAPAAFKAAYELEMMGRNGELDGADAAYAELEKQVGLLKPQLESITLEDAA